MDKNSADLRVIKTRQNIKNAVLELMSEKTISSITITDVSKKAMINRKTFYRHYNSVDSVYAEWLENDCKESLEFIVKTTRKISHACLSNLLAEEDIKNIDIR